MEVPYHSILPVSFMYISRINVIINSQINISDGAGFTMEAKLVTENISHFFAQLQMRALSSK